MIKLNVKKPTYDIFKGQLNTIPIKMCNHTNLWIKKKRKKDYDKQFKQNFYKIVILNNRVIGVKS